MEKTEYHLFLSKTIMSTILDTKGDIVLMEDLRILSHQNEEDRFNRLKIACDLLNLYDKFNSYCVDEDEVPGDPHKSWTTIIKYDPKAYWVRTQIVEEDDWIKLCYGTMDVFFKTVKKLISKEKCYA